MPGDQASAVQQQPLLARLYIDMFKCRCGVIVSSRPVRGGSDIEGCQYCVEWRFRRAKIVYARKPWESFDTHVRTYNGLCRLADRIREGRDLVFEVRKLREGIPEREVRRQAASRVAFVRPSRQAEEYLMIEFEEAADRPLLDDIARQVEDAARRMFARHGITWRDDRAMWLRLAEREPEFQALCPILRGRPPNKSDEPALLRLIGRLVALGWSERAATTIAARYADRMVRDAPQRTARTVEQRDPIGPMPELSERQRKKLWRVLDFNNLPPWLRRTEAIYVSGLSSSTFEKLRHRLKVTHLGKTPLFETASLLHVLQEGRGARART
jgi:hypothetical protein